MMFALQVWISLVVCATQCNTDMLSKCLLNGHQGGTKHVTNLDQH